MATYNGAHYLREQVDSILTQLNQGDELVVSDDGSTDATVAILQSYGAAVRIVGHGSAGGVVRNFSRAMSHANGDLILLADQDDVWLPGRATRMRDELLHCDLVFANAWVVDEQLRSTGVTLFDQLQPSLGFWHNLVKNRSFVGCCMGFRRSMIAKLLPLPSSTPWHDWLIGLFATLHGHVRQIETPLLLYRRHGMNASSTGAVSSNTVLRKAQLRISIVSALAVCLWRYRRRPV
jgi:glycosyltransferase involved in cell wall biosynthesis